MVDDVLVNAIGLIFGFGGSETLGDYVESKIKPGVTIGSTSQDKLIARVANNGPKLVLAYGVYTVGQKSPFIKNVAMGVVLSVIGDTYWRYLHQGAPPSAYTEVPIETPTGTPAPSGTPTTSTPTTSTPTGTSAGTSSSSGESPGEPDIGLLDSIFILDTDTLEDIIVKARILEEM